MKTILSLIFILGQLILFTNHGQSATITVTSIADSGPGTLRDAITQANVSPAADIIEFKIQPGGPQHILLNSVLPQITNSDLTIDGTTQINYSSYNYPIISIGENFGSNTVFQANGCNTIFKSLDVSYIFSAPASGKGFWIISPNKTCTIQNCWAKNRDDGIVVRFAGTSQVIIIGNDLTNSGNNGGACLEIAKKNGTLKAHSNIMGGNTVKAIYLDVVSNIIVGGTTGDLQVGTYLKDIYNPIHVLGGSNLTFDGINLEKSGTTGHYGMYIMNTAGVTITNCQFKNRNPGLGLKFCQNFVKVDCNLFHYNELGFQFDGIVAGTVQKIQDNNFICNVMAVRQFGTVQMIARSNYWNSLSGPPLNGFNGYAGNVDVSNYKIIPLSCALPVAWLCGTGTSQIWACHIQPGGTTQNMCINLSDAPTHMAHGDSLGKCKPNCCWDK